MTDKPDALTTDALCQLGAMRLAYQALFWEIARNDESAARRMIDTLRQFAAAPLMPGIAIDLEELIGMLEKTLLDHASRDDEPHE